jgi:Fe-S-cluster containining protein
MDARPVELDAGPFGEWLAAARRSVADGADAAVPCGECTACCRSGQFVVIEPDETATLARIPDALLVPAPGRPGHRVLGYDEHGRCPMLIDDRCSIYADRPRACRTYDCRVYAAAGVVPAGQPAVAAQVARWRFSHRNAADETAHDAVLRRAAALAALDPPTPLHLALRAVTSDA